MSFRDLPTLADQGRCAKSKGEKSSFDVKAEKRTAKEANWRIVCRQVDKRDGYKCRCCGAHGNPEGLDALDKLHRHHLTFRSKGGQDVAANLLLLCSRCHDRVHVKRTLSIEAQDAHGADGPLLFWSLPQTDGSTGFLLKRETACNVTERD